MDSYKNELEWIVEQNLPWELFENKTIMISGATGMIGKCMIDLIMLRNQKGYSPIYVTALSRNEKVAKERFGQYWDFDWFKFLPCDVNVAIPECDHVDYVIHAAGNTHPKLYAGDPIGTILTNVTGTKNMLDYAVRYNAKQFCFLSTVEIYGENRGDVDYFDESYLGYLDCNTLRAGYPESKRAGEALCNAYREAEGMPFVIPRLSRIYGTTMLESDTKAISQFVKKAMAGEDIVLKSAGTQMYSYTFVTDAVNAILHIMLLGKDGEAYNVSDSKSDISLKELAAVLAKKAGTNVVFELPDDMEKKGYSTATKAMLAPDKLEALGWKARVSIDKGMEIILSDSTE